MKNVRFGTVIENTAASINNPHRLGIFVREYYRKGKCNPGKTWVLTDGKGDFWEVFGDSTNLTHKGSVIPVIQLREATYPQGEQEGRDDATI